MNLYVYIHIPFCYKKCPYCSFISYEKSISTKHLYLKALVKEIESFFLKNNSYKIETIYFGGGTPSLLKPEELVLILNTIKKYHISKACEITIEVNPNNATKNYLQKLKEIGFTRISLGIQSFNNQKLQFLQRLHNAQESFRAIENTIELFDNVSIDLIYGFENFNILQEDLNNAVLFPLKHISAYILSIEKGTLFYKQKVYLQEENVEKQFLYLIKFLKKHNINQYEISNFAKKGFESKHNQAYWQNYDYIGFGLSASSHINSVRYKNTDNLDDYINKVLSDKSPVVYKERLNIDKQIKEAFVIGLRTIKGININNFNQRYNCNIEEIFKKELSKHYELKTLKKVRGSIKIANPKKLLISNYILSDFI
ncbi:MAG: radical SAM family heme chaperone HemW [Desulfurella sp.]|jgi:oxygen-independent coproporphyrinogen-3 oxidase|uniref:radical SAM family heme chaperone HemW n=1 Tax=Desulfurella TaxID=33001 RepID=UPI000CA80E8A|nr:MULTISPECIES: radical SAM family heme chaperone HemW [Desulfurella]PMP62626.1 MAG: coproporphyrinogen III oxidase [Desulfurella multipotens]PMP87611.1 MAG: coproporphyrinogen III oxidase [Desulfurella sp.]HEX14070.1 radical SAM family heme chaperone HemW [Desulfurella acetivorans]